MGAGCLVLGCYGLAELPTNPLGVGLLLLAMVGYGIDVQTGVPRVWSGIATVAFVAGSVVLYDGLSLSWVTLLVAIVGMSLAMLGGMPAMVRVRFSTPTIGREWMVGEVGTAHGAVAPDGVVTVRDAPWRARTSRVTPIDAGQQVRVVADRRPGARSRACGRCGKLVHRTSRIPLMEFGELVRSSSSGKPGVTGRRRPP